MCLLQGGEAKFTESAIFMVIHGRFLGKYVAACAKNECGYFGNYLSYQ